MAIPPLAPGCDPFSRLILRKDGQLDRREFEKFRINTLRVVVVSSEAYQDEMACNLIVGAGSNDEPSEFPGLAHLTEHLYVRRIFCELKTRDRKYKKSRNTTMDDFTHYRISVTDDNSVIPMFKKFLSIFACNNFTVDSIKGEVLVLTQEYETHRGCMKIRLEGATSLYHPPEGVIRGFTWGNIASLSQSAWGNDDRIRDLLSGQQEMSDEDLTQLQQALKEFTEEHYKLSNCVLIITGSKPLKDLGDTVNEIWKELEKMPNGKNEWAPPKEEGDVLPSSPGPSSPGPSSKGDGRKRKQSFNSQDKKTDASQAPVPTKRAKPTPKERSYEPPYVNQNFNKIYYVQPPEYEDEIVLSWVVPFTDEKEFSKAKPLHYISALLEEGKPGGLKWYLTTEDLITNMYLSTQGFCDPEITNLNLAWSKRYKAHLFSIFFTLTRKGIEKRRDVIAAVLWYLYKLKPDYEIYDVIREARSKRKELFGISRSQAATARKLGCAVLFPEAFNLNILTDDISLYLYNEKEIQGVLDILKSPKNMNVIIMANLGADVEKEFPNRKEFKGLDGQPMGFKYGMRDFTAEELDKWFSFPNASSLYDLRFQVLRMPTKNNLGYLKEHRNYVQARAIVDAYNINAGWKQPAKEINISGGGKRVLHVTEQVHFVPFAWISVTLRPPGHIVSEQLRAYMEVFNRMFRFITALESMWVQQECVIATSEVHDTGKVTITINGVAPWAVDLLESILQLISDPSKAFRHSRDLLLEDTRKRLLSLIHDPQKFTEDLFMRGALVGYMPYIESYNHVVRAAQDQLLYERLTSFFAQMEIIVRAQTNVLYTFDDCVKIFPKLPPFVSNPPPALRPPIGAHYRWSDFEDNTRNPKQSTFRIQNPNRGSHISCVRHSYFLHKEAWKKYDPQWTVALNLIFNAVEQGINNHLKCTLRIVYKTSVELEFIDDQPMLKITVISDSKRTTCARINSSIEEALRQAIDDISEQDLLNSNIFAGHAKMKRVYNLVLFGRGDQNPLSYPWKYIIQIEGASDRALATEGSNISAGAIDYATYDPEGQNGARYADAQVEQRNTNPLKPRKDRNN